MGVTCARSSVRLLASSLSESLVSRLFEFRVNDDNFVFHAMAAREVLEQEVNMKTVEEMLDEIENSDDGNGPDPVATVDDPALAKIAVAQIRLRAAERALDEDVMDARNVGLSWQAIEDVLGMTRRSANKRFHIT
ncbi:hypothetical protein HMPREF1549_03036 [Actinomyces johnsonii F0510]|uniref:Uncharacterized protein n=1 Tax=Actinomyces johnsonii F0510 TaxID=1227262 RepID=U1Q0A8_9ACTO|nr:hypothetical protein HMPREF1549_03036 [Actinomyces johnsonii F0510]